MAAWLCVQPYVLLVVRSAPARRAFQTLFWPCTAGASRGSNWKSLVSAYLHNFPCTCLQAAVFVTAIMRQFTALMCRPGGTSLWTCMQGPRPPAFVYAQQPVMSQERPVPLAAR